MTSETLQVLSPLRGWSATLDDNPDEVFRSRMLGDGASIDPLAGEVHAPFDGTVLTVPGSRHAINLRADMGAEFLIHVGVDTVAMAGEGFEAHAVHVHRLYPLHGRYPFVLAVFDHLAVIEILVHHPFR